MKIKVLSLCLVSLLIFGAAPGNNKIKMNWYTHIGTFASCNDPVLHEDVLYIGCAGQKWNASDSKDGVYAFNAATGGQLWFYKTPNDANGCTYHNGIIYAGDDSGKLTALDADTGTEKWSVNLRGKIYGKPLVYNNHVYTATGSGHIYSIKLTGQMDREIYYSTGVRAELVEYKGNIYCLLGESAMTADSVSKLLCLNPSTLAVQWNKDISGYSFMPSTAAPIGYGDSIIISLANCCEDDLMLAVNYQTGADMWTAKKPQHSEYFWGNTRAVPALEDNLLYCIPSESDYLYIIDAQSGDFVAAHTVQDIRSIGYNGGSIIDQWASPVIRGDEYVLVSDTGIVQGFNKKTGSREWTFNPVAYITGTFEDNETDIYYDELHDRQYQQDKFYATPIIYKNNLIAASDDGYLISIKIP